VIRAVRADITALHVDAIVNAANEALVPGGCVDGAIHRAAGPELERACAAVGGCPTGEARITPGFRLPARFVIHTVGPVYHGGGSGEAEQLARCYRNALELALGNGVRSIAFPCISTGVFGYPPDAAARIAVTAMRDYEDRFEEIVACCFGAADEARYQRLLGRRSEEPEPPA
jgi:O-acetyl-ADP-ribose deacetylase (regulator of RNase III)